MRAIVAGALLLGAGQAVAQTPPAPAPAPAPVKPADGAAAVLAAAHQALGGAALDALATTHDTGKVTNGGLAGTYDDWLDWVHVRNATLYTLGPASGGQGWTGQAAWSMDASRQVRVETSAEAKAAAASGAYFAVLAYLYPQRSAAVVTDAGSRSDGGVSYPALKVTPQGADAVEVWFDPATHLPARMVQLTGAQPQTTLLSDWRRVGGVMQPFHVVVRVGNDPKYDTVIDTATFAAEAVPDSRFAPPAPPAYDAQFPAGKTAVTFKFRLLNNHIYLPVAIDDKPAIPFMFDTGATNFMDAAHAAQLGLKTQGAIPGGGFGSAISSVGLVKVGSVGVGPVAQRMTLHDQIFATNDLSGLLKVEGTDAGGLVGYEFAKRAVVTIDYAARTIGFTRPEAFHAPAGATAVPFSFSAHIPMVKGTLDGVAGEFEIDTGSRGALTVMAPFAQANGLDAKMKATVLATVGYGVGGPSKALLARAGSLTIGGVTIDRPVVELVQDAHGAGAAAHTAGNIGGDLLQRFTVTLDYGHQIMYLQPNALAKTTEVFDRAGLWVNRAPDGMIAIGDITPGGAASRVKLTVGDEIIAVGSTDTRKMELSELRTRFKGAPGTVLRLTVRQANGHERTVALTLADQV